MNWFEDDHGNWWNLDKAKAVYPPGQNDGEIEFNDTDSRGVTANEWPRLLAQLRNIQRQADRRPFGPIMPKRDAPDGDDQPASILQP